MRSGKNNLLTMVAVLLMPIMANADPITFVLETALDDDSDVGTFQGYITFDSADVFAFNTVTPGDFIDWAFSWGSESIAAGGLAEFAPASFITFDASSEITTWAVCVTTPVGCGAAQAPGFLSDSRFFGGVLNFATADGVGSINNGVEQAWTKVPEPGTFALFCVGLIGMGLARRKIA